MRGRSIGTSASTRAGRRREQEDPAGNPDRFLDVVGNKKGCHRAARDQIDEFGAQSCRNRGVERDERFIEPEQLWFDRERGSAPVGDWT